MNTAEAALRRVTATLDGAEDRAGQQQMAGAVERAIDQHRHLIVQAGTGTGKTLAYLVPAVLSGKRVVVATATKALQDQLATKDLPFLAGCLGAPFEFSVLKGRSNYVCLQRVREIHDESAAQLEIEELSGAVRAEVARLCEWAGVTRTGDVAERADVPSDAAWKAVSVGSDECPGGSRCTMGSACFAEAARERAAAAQVVVVNLHLYGLHVASGNMLLPEHDVVVIDEAHQLEDIMSATVGMQISPARCNAAATALKRILAEPGLVAAISDSANQLRGALAGQVGKRLNPLPEGVQDALLTLRRHLDAALAALRSIESKVADVQQRTLRAQQVATRLVEHIDATLAAGDSSVIFVSGSDEHAWLEVAPLEVGPSLQAGVWSKRTAVLTSATVPASLARRTGLPPDAFDEIDVGSPFDYETSGLLYCALHLPDPRSPEYTASIHEELATLIAAAGGRTLALFTSWRAMRAAAEALSVRLPFPLLSQGQSSKRHLLERFIADESSCLFATAGFFQGIDVPGRTLSLVTIDRLPFPRPDDPLLSARRDVAGAGAFAEIDLPRAAMLLAQATGRLIRTRSDRGVVAVLDRRLGTARYRWDMVSALPPLRRTRHQDEVVTFLRSIADDQASSR